MMYERLWDAAGKQTDVEKRVTEALLRGAIDYSPDTLYNNLSEELKCISAKPITRSIEEIARRVAEHITWEFGNKRKEGLASPEIVKELTKKYRLTEKQQKAIFAILF